MNMTTYTRINSHLVKVGEPLQQSIYRKNGDLLLKKGRIITTERQRELLLKLGVSPEIPGTQKQQAPRKAFSKLRTHSENQEDIFDIKSRWLEDLYRVFNLTQNKQVSNFSYRVLMLACEIQVVSESQHDALLAAFQLDHDNHYGLVHALHCGVICETIARGIGLSRVERLAIVAGALTHDLGIVEDQDKLHQQQTPLTDLQWSEVQKHPQKGQDKLKKLGVDDNIWLDIALHHHERLDGTGYPDKLTGDEIPLGVRIMTVADIYTAIIRPTKFRSENSGKSALTVLYKERGTTLEPRLVDVLINEIGIYPLGSLVKLHNNEIGVVIKRGDVKSQPLVSALLSPEGEIYQKSKMRLTNEEQFKIINEVSLAKNRFIQANIENEWACTS